jgi:hypothetical protein
MTAATKRTRRTTAPTNGAQPTPKAGSPAQREMIEDLAQDVMQLERVIWRTDKDMVKRGDEENDPAFQDGQRIIGEDGEQVTYKQRKEILRDQIGNLEAGYPTLMPSVRKLIRRARKEMDAQE